jgi:hypothetical protein
MQARQNRAARTPRGKRNLNRAKNRVWDSWPTRRHAPRVDSQRLFPERAMDVRTLVVTLLIANLTNAVCLYAYL